VVRKKVNLATEGAGERMINAAEDEPAGSTRQRAHWLVDVVNAIRTRQTTQPKTVLGFFWSSLALILGLCVTAVLILAKTNTMTNLIPFILGFGGVVFVLVLAGVFIVMLADPTKLMLGQVSGTEYFEGHRIRLGDSERGEHVETILGPGTSGLPALPDRTDSVTAEDQP
jgi:hypothetical protein